MSENSGYAPMWLDYSLKGVITVLTVVALVMLVDNVRKHKDMIKANLLMISLYTVMCTALLVDLLDVWVDAELFCESTFALQANDEIFVANDFVQFILVQLVFLLTLESMLFARN